MDNRYAYILTTIFVTFTFGFGIPILFPICAVSMLVEYVVTVTRLYWQYRIPPAFDEKLAQQVLSQLKWAPFIFVIFGYWMASSKQLYSNDYVGGDDFQLQTSTSMYESRHIIWSFLPFTQGWEQPCWGLLLTLYFFLFAFLLYNFGGQTLQKIIKEKFKWFMINIINFDEELDFYSFNLGKETREEIVNNEKANREQWKLNLLSDATYEKY